MITCFDCGSHMTPDDIEDGEIRCIDCDEKLIERIKTWQQGRIDHEMDILATTKGLIH